ncbi:MAG TPA: hypothetical protein VI248_15160 [Kineosporiaceae bacterium]
MGTSASLRVAVVTESFLPILNGATTRVCRIVEHLQRRGDQALVIYPGPAPAEFAGAPVVALPAGAVYQTDIAGYARRCGLPARRYCLAVAAEGPRRRRPHARAVHSCPRRPARARG